MFDQSLSPYFFPTRYPRYEYYVAVVIAAGVGMFTLASKQPKSGQGESTTASGVFLILSYLTFDSFTSQWQRYLFETYKVSSYQMMLGINFFSAAFTFASLCQTGELGYALSFLAAHPPALWHVFLIGVAGAMGQPFIFYTPVMIPQRTFLD